MNDIEIMQELRLKISQQEDYIEILEKRYLDQLKIINKKKEEHIKLKKDVTRYLELKLYQQWYLKEQGWLDEFLKLEKEIMGVIQMNKALLISIQPQHAINILNGKKTLELRTWIPKGYKGWVYVYVTKNEPYLIWNNGNYVLYTPKINLAPYSLNGKVAFRFWFDEYDEYNDYSGCTNNENGYECENEYMYHLCELPNKMKELCLTCDEIETYGNGKTLYAWHIKKLEIFDTPKQLSDFIVGLNYLGDIIPPTYKKLTKAPQKMQWVYNKI